ncbi:ParB N-terminal domain-containing protein, partial [Psychrobacter pygoscelis]|uniref:ParB N-terminal domain-containing protein n=1 Tax=Psychrobacter pygoscelis TaxID=2488563 RepID=UPI001039865D
MLVELVPIDLISATEEIDIVHQQELCKIIKSSGFWIHPIIIHDEQLFVMDGHHRLASAKQLNLSLIPAVKLNYREVEVSSWREDYVINEQVIFKMYNQKKLFPHKTTKHIFPTPLPECL